MTSGSPAHGSSAQVSEFTVDVDAHGVVQVETSLDANRTLQILVTRDQERWRLDVAREGTRFVIREAYHDGAFVHTDEVPTWLDTVLEAVAERFGGVVG